MYVSKYVVYMYRCMYVSMYVRKYVCMWICRNAFMSILRIVYMSQYVLFCEEVHVHVYERGSVFRRGCKFRL